jgi:hypothetical protein
MVGGLIRFRQHGQVKVFPRWLVIRLKRYIVEQADVVRDSLKRYLFRGEARLTLRFNVSDYFPRRCHSLLIVRATRRAV